MSILYGPTNITNDTTTLRTRCFCLAQRVFFCKSCPLLIREDFEVLLGSRWLLQGFMELIQID